MEINGVWQDRIVQSDNSVIPAGAVINLDLYNAWVIYLEGDRRAAASLDKVRVDRTSDYCDGQKVDIYERDRVEKDGFRGTVLMECGQWRIRWDAGGYSELSGIESRTRVIGMVPYTESN